MFTHISTLSFLSTLSLLFITLLSCSDPIPTKCESNSDCREGYICDLEVYIGECIKKQIRCGAVLCNIDQVCQNNTCVSTQVIPNPTPDRSTNPQPTDISLDYTYPTDQRIIDQQTSNPTDMSNQRYDRQVWEDNDHTITPRDMALSDRMLPDFAGAACTHTCDCTPGLACQNGACTLKDEPVYCCDNLNACPSDQACESRQGNLNICPKPPCSNACDCNPGFACINGECSFSSVIGGGEVSFCCDNTCPTGVTCQNRNGTIGICEGNQGVCRTACDCEGGLDCLNGRCTFAGNFVFCCSSATCPQGQNCVNEQGEFGQCPSQPCTTACDCTPGLSCVNGTCANSNQLMFCCNSNLPNSCPSGQACQNPNGSTAICR